jgi:hypothetical protein
VAKKKSLIKATARKAIHSRSSSTGLRVVVDPDAKPSPAAKRAQRLFSAGVQQAYKNLAKHGVKTVVVEDGKLLKAVPRLTNGRFVVERLQRKG